MAARPTEAQSRRLMEMHLEAFEKNPAALDAVDIDSMHNDHGKVIAEKRDISKTARRLGTNVTYKIGQWQYGNYRDRLMTTVTECVDWCEAEDPCWHWNFHSIDAMCNLKMEGAWFEPGEEQLGTQVWFAGNSSRANAAAGARRLTYGYTSPPTAGAAAGAAGDL